MTDSVTIVAIFGIYLGGFVTGAFASGAVIYYFLTDRERKDGK